jgi:hypothetical protein
MASLKPQSSPSPDPWSIGRRIGHQIPDRYRRPNPGLRLSRPAPLSLGDLRRIRRAAGSAPAERAFGHEDRQPADARHVGRQTAGTLWWTISHSPRHAGVRHVGLLHQKPVSPLSRDPDLLFSRLVGRAKGGFQGSRSVPPRRGAAASPNRLTGRACPLASIARCMFRQAALGGSILAGRGIAAGAVGLVARRAGPRRHASHAASRRGRRSGVQGKILAGTKGCRRLAGWLLQRRRPHRGTALGCCLDPSSRGQPRQKACARPRHRSVAPPRAVRGHSRSPPIGRVAAPSIDDA